jgi:hypothetical protein
MAKITDMYAVDSCYSANGPLAKLNGHCPFLCTEVGETFCIWSFYVDIDEPDEEDLPKKCPLRDSGIHVERSKKRIANGP